MKREYFIAHWKQENERAIFRKDEDGDIVQWLSWELVWTKEKRYAKRFLHEQDAVSSLSIIKSKWDLKTEEEYIDEVITEKKKKMSWWEL
jgi:hypothetical protein